MDAKYLEAHRALLKKFAAVNADARKLLASGAKLGLVVKLATQGEQILAARCGDIEAHLAEVAANAAAKEKTASLPTKESYLAEFAGLDAKGLQKTKETIEAALKEDPNRVDAKLALEAIDEVIAAAAKK